MGKRSDTDKIIRNVINWADRPEWSEVQATVIDAHTRPLCDRIGISQAKLAEELEAHGYTGMVFGMMFEDFLSRRLPPDGRNVVDDYLKRRGWRDSVLGRRYLQKLRDSVLSLYEVVAVSPGRHCDLRELVRDPEGDTIRVFEHMGTQNLVTWDHLAARVLKIDGKYVFSGGILPFPRDASQNLMQMLTESRKEYDNERSQAADEEARDPKLSSVNQDDLFLQNSCPAFTCVWLMHILNRLHAPLPEMHNRDGEALAFSETRFPILAENAEEIARRLDATSEWERDSPAEYSWAWLSEPDNAGKKSQQRMGDDSLEDRQLLLYGSLEMDSGVLAFTAHSMERARRGQDLLEALLHGLIGPALSVIQTPEQMMAEDDSRQPGGDQPEPADSIDPELAAGIIRNALDQHYRRTLDEPIPALGNKTPRQCCRSKKGREKVIEWLKQLENSELRRAANEGQAPYDCDWMWEELKLTRHRD